MQKIMLDAQDLLKCERCSVYLLEDTLEHVSTAAHFILLSIKHVVFNVYNPMSMVYWYLVMSIYFYFVPTLIAIVVVLSQSFFLLYSIVRLIMFKVETV